MTQYFTYDSNLKDRNKYTSTVETTFGTRRYFSSLDTEVYFGQTQIDEMVAIDFTIAEPKLPIYGFNSFYPNRIVAGRRTVQGTFAINFTHTMYLLNILNSIDDSILSNDYEAMIYRCPEEDSTGLGIGNSALFNKRFDITISYGYGKTEGKQTYNSCYQTIVGVQIVDYRQALDTEGNPILDMYSFIAKDIRYQESVATDPDNGSINPDGGPGGTVCEVCGKDPCECVPGTDAAPSYIVANNFIKGDMNELVSQTTNTDVSGFIVSPLFYMSNDKYYISLSIETVNNNTEVFKNISATVSARSLGINFSCDFKDLKNGITTAYPLTDSLRESAVKLMREYKNKDGYGAIFSLKFTADFDGKELEIPFDTYLTGKK